MGRLDGARRALDEWRSKATQTLRGGITGSVSPGDVSLPELVEIATVQEYGTRDGRIPPRPFLRTSLMRYGRTWATDLVVSGPELAGVLMRGDIQRTLRDGPWAPNAPSTVRAKGSSMPLVDSGQLVNSIRVEHEDASGVTRTVA